MQQLNFLTTSDYVKRQTQRDKLEDKLKHVWMSYTDMIVYFRAGSIDRRCRDLRANLPEGYKIIERQVKQAIGRPFKEFKLVKE